MTPHTSANLAFIGAEKRTPAFKVTDQQWRMACEMAKRTGSKVVVGSTGCIFIDGCVWTPDEIGSALQQMDGDKFNPDVVIEYEKLIGKEVNVISANEIAIEGAGTFTYGEIHNMYAELCATLEMALDGDRKIEFLRG